MCFSDARHADDVWTGYAKIGLVGFNRSTLWLSRKLCSEAISTNKTKVDTASKAASKLVGLRDVG